MTVRFEYSRMQQSEQCAGLKWVVGGGMGEMCGEVGDKGLEPLTSSV